MNMVKQEDPEWYVFDIIEAQDNFQGKGTSFVDLLCFCSVFFCVCYVFVRVCLYVLCGHLHGKG